MMSPLRSIVYVSTAVNMLTEPQLEVLLIEARDFNLRNGITGVLLYDYGCFMLSTARWAVLEQETQKAASTPPGLLLLKEFWQGARRR